jgi:TatA/E family protein of Tat protein translocase
MPSNHLAYPTRTASASVARPRRRKPTPRLAEPAPRGNWQPLGWLILLGVALLGALLLGLLSLAAAVVLVAVVALLFGRKLPEMGRYLGKGIVEFKKGVKALKDDAPSPQFFPNHPLKFGEHTGSESAPPRTHRATIRYYSRMNPERVYPLLVLITRDQIEQVRQAGVDQRASSPFAVAADVPVEVEPVLPGCDCYPPRASARPGEGDLTLTFRVVPRVLGEVGGAVVHVRQGQASLAEVELDVKVVRRTWALASGLAAFLMPGLSAVMKHFGLGFDAQGEGGFSFYLWLARLTFDHFSPLALTVLLGSATFLLWWLTRPRRRDVFWDFGKAGKASGRHAAWT